MTGLHDLAHRYPTVKGFRGREGPNVMRFKWTKSKACWSACLEQSRIVCLSQEERVAGLMSEECPFLKEIKRRDRDPLRSLVQSK